MALAALRRLVHHIDGWRGRARRLRLAGALLRAGLIDHEYLRAQLGAAAGDDAAAAATAWARTEERLGYAPHPLIEPAWWSDGRTLGPLLPEPVTGAGIVRAGRLCAALTDTDVLPGTSTTWRRFRAESIEAAEHFRLQDERSRRRPVPHWEPDPTAPLVTTGDLVTVVMPVRDREAVVGAAIASVVRQRYPHWELIVVDDGSTDGTAAVVDDWVARDARIRRIRHEPSGVSGARNRGIRAGSGRWVAFLDSDNQWTEQHLAAAVAAIDDSSAVHTAVRIAAGDGVSYLAEPTDRASLLDGRNAVDMNALVAPRAAIDRVGGFAEELRRWVDYDLVLRLSESLAFRFVPVLGVDYDHRDEATDRITTRESPRWRRVVLARALLDHDRLVAQAGAADLQRLTVILRTRNQWRDTLRTVDHLLALDEVSDVVVVDAASFRSESGILRARAAADPRLRVLRSAVDWGRSLSMLVALQWVEGATVVMLEPGSVPDPQRLREAIVTARSGPQLDPAPADGVLAIGAARDLARTGAIDLIEDPLEPAGAER